MWPRNIKFGLHIVSIWVNIEKKFQVPRSLSIGEKYDAILKWSSNFSRKLFDRETWNFVCIEYPYGLIYKKISSSSVAQYRRKVQCYFKVIIAFFSKTVWPRNMKFGLHRGFVWVNIQKKFQVPWSHSIGEKCDAILLNFKVVY